MQMTCTTADMCFSDAVQANPRANSISCLHYSRSKRLKQGLRDFARAPGLRTGIEKGQDIGMTGHRCPCARGRGRGRPDMSLGTAYSQGRFVILSLLPGHPARVEVEQDGRSPDSRVTAAPAPSRRKWRQWSTQDGSPLTVAGAVAELAPDGYTSPHSLLVLLAVQAARNRHER